MFAFGIPTIISALVVCVNLLQFALFQMLDWTSSVQVPTRGIIICLVCILCSLVGATTAYAIRQNLEDHSKKSGRSYFHYLVIALVACAFGDAFYAYSYFIAALPTGSIEHLYSDFLYNIFAIYIGIASIKRTFYQHTPTLTTPSFGVFIGLTLLLMGVHYVSIVEPLIVSDPNIISNILTISYNVFEAIFMAGALMASLRAGTIYEFILWTSVALLGVSNIAVNAIDDSLNSSHLRLFDYGWQWGLSGICIALLGLFLNQQVLKRANASLNTQVSFRSLRTMTVLFGLGGMLIASYIFWYFKEPDLTFASHFNSRLTISSELASLFVVWCLSNMFAILISRRLVAFCQSLYASVLMGDENMTWVLQSRIPSELRPILASLKAVLSRLRLSYELNAQLRTDASIATLAAQVAHDIRSPLMALQAINTRSHMLDAETQQLIQTATQRIYDITGELLVKCQSEEFNKYETNDSGHAPSRLAPETYSNTLIYPVIESICTEVKLSSKTNVPITTSYRNTSDVFLSSYIKPKIFRSILANLLHNAVESTLGRPNPAVAVEFEESDDHRIILRIKDNGLGFSHEALQHFAQKGFTTKGNQGHGLGLWHSKLQIESFGGNLNLASNSSEGATLQIELPLANNSETNISVIDLRDREIVVVDDEAHTHIMWEQLITERKQLAQTLHSMLDVGNIENKQFYAHHFETIDAAQHFVQTQREQGQLHKYIFLIDHEFKNSPKTGGQFIIENNLNHQAILVTAHTDTHHITDQLGGVPLKILPKVLLPMVQVQVTADVVDYALPNKSIFSPERFKTSAST